MLRPAPGPGRDLRGQVLVMVAILLVVLLAFAGLAIDVGRQSAEHRTPQRSPPAVPSSTARRTAQRPTTPARPPG
jgi:uncharacterized membrane protein